MLTRRAKARASCPPPIEEPKPVVETKAKSKAQAKKPAKPKRAAKKTKASGPIAKKPKFGFLNFATNEIDPIIENLREVSLKFKQTKNVDEEIAEQISLEGLTGLTFGHLCRLLDAAIPNLNSVHDDKVQDYVWNVLATHYLRRSPGASIQAFYLDATASAASKTISPRKDGPSTQESDCSNKGPIIDKEIKLSDHTLKRIAKYDWMLHPVQDGDIMGSCAHYLSRINITQEIIDLTDLKGPRESLHQFNSKYNLKNIYFVSDQDLRKRMLIPHSYDPNINIKLREYACLELIGRTRCLGIVFPNDKSLGRYRILLTGKKLITQFQQTCNSYIVHHIKKFADYNLEVGQKPFKLGVLPVGYHRPTLSLEDDDDDDDEFGDYDERPTVRNTCCNPRRMKMDCDMLRMVYDMIALSKGRSILDVRAKLKLPKSHARNCLKSLVNIGMIVSQTRVVGDKVTRMFRARHKSNRRKIARQKIIKGVKAKWDEVDIRAKELLGHRRSHFSQAEDSLLILCRISSLLLEPNLKKLSFCVPKQTVRDTLHDELFEAHDKTSDSLLRRIKYLRHLPTNKNLINELCAELREDSDIVRLIEARAESRSEEKLCKLFRQLLRAVRAKLPHLLGLTSSLNTNSSRTISIKSSADLKEKFELVDCQMPIDNNSSASLAHALTRATNTTKSMANTRETPKSGSQSTSASSPPEATGASPSDAQAAAAAAAASSSKLKVSRRAAGPPGGLSHQQPISTLIQLAQPISDEVQLNLAECKGMKSILNLVSFCTASSFQLNLELKVPVRVVGLDQDNEHFKDIFEKAKESKETSRIIADLTTPNPTADSRRALFMLRNALKLQTLEKCGKLADALIVRPCDIRFSSDEKIVFNQQHLIHKFLKIKSHPASGNRDPREPQTGRKTRGQQTKRAAAAAAAAASANQPAAIDEPDSSRIPEPSPATSTTTPTAPARKVDPSDLIEYKQLLKSIELMLSWISVYPGIELATLRAKTVDRLMDLGDVDGDPLVSLLELMEGLDLISSQRNDISGDTSDEEIREPRLFGYRTKPRKMAEKLAPPGGVNSTRSKRAKRTVEEPTPPQLETPSEPDSQLIITYEPRANAYVRYCQLINIDLQ